MTGALGYRSRNQTLMQGLDFNCNYFSFSSSESRPAGLEESDQSSMSGDQGMSLEKSGPKLSDFASRPPGSRIFL